MLRVGAIYRSTGMAVLEAKDLRVSLKTGFEELSLQLQPPVWVYLAVTLLTRRVPMAQHSFTRISLKGIQLSLLWIYNH